MNTFWIITLLVCCFAAYLYAAWLDNQHNWKLVDWFNGKTSNPFKVSEKARYERSITKKDKEIQDLKERIQVLEKIVTEPAYELNKKINAL
ncbi:MAG: hypothetical protein Alis3KO_40530 [Aliiglaciecola sp.]|uniref:hypothetical protein n=1 Tax=Aliiglaciecola sp. M165 TaxID=2593649 RepID=UPI00117DA277|nr:hypothetical protein [Aliiglaciecola sp. M165]TRY33370.1 hypothetical protein FM019_05180 [Aliiglaciecola sp. M165]